MNDVYSVFVSNAADGDIGAYRFEAATGRLEVEGRLLANANVMPLALSLDAITLYAATRRHPPGIVTYPFDAKTGALTRRHTAPIESNLAYMSADASGRYLLGASYGENRASLYDAARIAQGEGGALQFVDDIQNAHCALSSRDGRFAYVSSLGSDTLRCF